MLTLTTIRPLFVRTMDGRNQSISAASGLVLVGDYAYVIADDELALAVFDRQAFITEPNQPGNLIPLLPGELPVDAAARKRQKPDWEALLLLPACAAYANGALLVLGSGSGASVGAQRQSAVLWPLDTHGALLGTPQRHTLAPFYQQLRQHVPELNIEAAFVCDDQLHLISRGNQGNTTSYLFCCDVQSWLRALTGTAAEWPPVQCTSLSLPEIGGVVCSISDAVALSTGWLATAVAEATADSYHDGACVGAALAQFDHQHRLQAWWPLPEPIKMEGVVAQQTNDQLIVWLVNDPDDRAQTAYLYQTSLTLSSGSALA